jgi:hypothetical protein
MSRLSTKHASTKLWLSSPLQACQLKVYLLLSFHVCYFGSITKGRNLLLLVIAGIPTFDFVVISAQQEEGGRCTVCSDGSPIPDPTKQINGVPGTIPLNDCATLDFATTFLTLDSDDCKGIQQIGSICGCPIADNTCQVCPDTPIRTPQKELPDLEDLVPGRFDIYRRLTLSSRVSSLKLHYTVS